MQQQVSLFCDGCSLGNPGRGGYGVILKYKEHVKELKQGFYNTTNNRMELRAVIAGLEAIKRPCAVTVTTDSRYVKDGIQKWIGSWKRNGWLTSDKKPVKNQDLWRRLDELTQVHQLSWKWVKGHSGHPENERCDVLAKSAAGGAGLIADQGYIG